MIRVAAGETLDIRQEDVKLDGWAVEARIYAEDPVRGFLPSTGRLVRWRTAPESDEIRNDTGVVRSEEHTSELQSLMRISYAVFCLKKKTTTKESTNNNT